MRKDAGLEISDRIELGYAATGEVAEALVNFGEYVQGETLTAVLHPTLLTNSLFSQTVKVGDADVMLSLQKA